MIIFYSIFLYENYNSTNIKLTMQSRGHATELYFFIFTVENLNGKTFMYCRYDQINLLTK